MRLEWRETARNEWRRIGLRNAAEGAVAGLGAAIAIGTMEWLSVASDFPLAIIRFATSICSSSDRRKQSRHNRAG